MRASGCPKLESGRLGRIPRLYFQDDSSRFTPVKRASRSLVGGPSITETGISCSWSENVAYVRSSHTASDPLLPATLRLASLSGDVISSMPAL